MKRLAIVTLAGVVAFAPCLAFAQAAPPPSGGPGPVSSEDDPAAHFERGVSFFQTGDYVAAMIEFERAYKLDPRPQVLYNIGQTSRELRDYARALKSFERYLAESGDAKEDRKKQVEGYVTELKGKVARLEVSVDVEGAEVTVDDLLVGRTPLAEPLVVNAGRRKVEVKKAGYASITRQVEIAGTSSEKLDFALEPLVAPRPAPVTATPPVVAPPPAETASAPVGRWVALGITGALGVATGVVGAVALGKGSDFDDALAKVPNDKDTIDDARSSARTFAITADVLGAATIAAGVTTIILFAVESSSGASADKTAVRPILGPGFVGVDARF